MKQAIATISMAGAAGAALVTGVVIQSPNFTGSDVPAIELWEASDPDTEVCLRSNLQFFENARRGCSKKGDIAGWSGAPVLDNRGAAVLLSLSHPTDFTRDDQIIRTCAGFTRFNEAGWYAASTSEMRREAYFQRACGALTYLLAAQKPENSYFERGKASAEDIQSFSKGPPFRIAPRAALPAESDPATVSEGEDGIWKVAAGDQQAQVQEIAHADFNDDGLGDILAYVALGVRGASARAGQIGLLEKKSETGAVRFREKVQDDG